MKREREERVQSFCIICTTFGGNWGKSEEVAFAVPHLPAPSSLSLLLVFIIFWFGQVVEGIIH
jgi:hypothetical protein